MNRILNPFESLSIGRALGWGLAGALLSLVLVFISRSPFEFSVSELFTLLSTNLVQWLFLSSLLYFSALLFSSSRIRALDIFATNIFAMLPMTLSHGACSVIFRWIRDFNADPQSALGLTIYGVYYLMLLVSSISLVWSMVWGCQAYLVSANIKSTRGIVIYAICFAAVNLVIQLVITYFGL